MTPSPRILKLALYCANQELEARRRGKYPGLQAWNHELVTALQNAYALSRAGHQDSCDTPQSENDSWIGTEQTAAILHWHPRRVRRHQHDLEARKVAGGLVFRESTVREYAEGLTHARTTA